MKEDYQSQALISATRNYDAVVESRPGHSSIVEDNEFIAARREDDSFLGSRKNTETKQEEVKWHLSRVPRRVT